MGKLVVNKIKRHDKIPDIPIRFKPLKNLHLDLLENPLKLKENPQIPKTKNYENKSSDKSKTSDSESKTKSGSKSKSGPKSKSKKKENFSDDDIDDEEEEEFSSMEMEFAESDVSGDGSSEIDEMNDIDDENDLDDESDSDDPYKGMSPEEREEKEKEDYLWKLKLLKKEYANSNFDIEEYNEHTSLETLKSVYNNTARELKLDSSVETYRTYLTIGFLGMEFICCTIVGIDMGGFANHQLRMMGKYDSLLIQLGEKREMSFGANFPVEVRLMGLIVFNAAIFYLGKIMEKREGGSGMVENLMNMLSGNTLNGNNGGTPNVSSNESSNEPPKEEKQGKMRGPRTTADDIRKMRKEN